MGISPITCDYPHLGAGVWVEAQVDPLKTLGAQKRKHAPCHAGLLADRVHVV